MRQLMILFVTLFALNLNAQECELTVYANTYTQMVTNGDTTVFNDTIIYAFEHGDTVTLQWFDTTLAYFPRIEGATPIGQTPWLSNQWLIQCGALPVELVYFDSEVIADGNILYWRTAMEENVDYFEIQLSSDGRFFYPIHKEKAKNKPAQYNHLHEHVIGTVYYRLKSVDFDSSEQYSDIITVESYQDKIVIQNPLPQGDTTHDHKFYIYDFMGRYLGMNVSNLSRGIYLFENPKPNYTFVAEVK